MYPVGIEATAEQIKAAIATLQPGADVVLTLCDGPEVRGVVRVSDCDGETTSLENSDQPDLNAGQITGVAFEASSEGLE